MQTNKMYYIQLYCQRRLRKTLQIQGAQSLRSEAYFCVGRKDEGCSATQYMGSRALQGILRRR
jgi:hypothetical protein